MREYVSEDESIKLYNGDCLDVMDLLIENRIKVDCVITDPPYGMDFQSSRRKIKHDKIKNDKDINTWIDDFVDKINLIMNDNTHGYVFCSFHQVDIFKQSIEKRFKIKNILIWEKNNHGTGDLKGDYAPKYEMIIYFHKGRRFLNGKRDCNILKFNKTKNELHPTQKPIDIMEYLVDKSTSINEVVLDCFMGSNSTGVACKNLNRRFIGIELDDKYFDIAVDRISK